jgi:Tfp pilus assembly protein PilN
MTMLQRLTTYITTDKQVTGLEVVLLADGQHLFRGAVLSLAKGVVTVQDRWEAESLDQLQRQLDKNLPVALLLNGKGILHRQVLLENTEQAMDDHLLASVLPAVKPAEFYVQHYRAETAGFFSLARRETVDRLLDMLQQQGLKVVRLGFGPFGFGSIWPFVGEGKEARSPVELPGHRLEMSEVGIIGYQATPLEGGSSTGTVKIGEDELEGQHVLAYASAFSCLVEMATAPVLKAGSVEATAEEHRQQKLFRAGAAVALLFFFVLLLGNFLAFSSLSGQNAVLKGQMGSKKSSLGQLNGLEREVKEKREFLTATGWLGAPRLSFYADRLAATLPAAISLTELSLYPVDQKRSKVEGKQVFQMGAIAVRGTCKNPVELNEWLKTVGQLAWVARVERQNYAFDEASGVGAFEFYLQLKGGKD